VICQQVDDGQEEALSSSLGAHELLDVAPALPRPALALFWLGHLVHRRELTSLIFQAELRLKKKKQEKGKSRKNITNHWLLRIVFPCAEDKDGNVVLRSRIKDVVGDGNHPLGVHAQSGLLKRFALGACEIAFAHFEMTTGELPFTWKEACQHSFN